MHIFEKASWTIYKRWIHDAYEYDELDEREKERGLGVRGTILTDCELKFQDISDCLRRLIAPLLLRKKPVDFLSMANISPGDEDDEDDDDDDDNEDGHESYPLFSIFFKNVFE
ncbi:hypothetical protein M0802_007091 [Mischocyttarus mexicanus]|nr:hypothetical protein M0802_007091 [Mischocyttarus mexicanus]